MEPSIRLLIVEDSEDDALLIVREIRKGGYRVEPLRVSSRQEFQEALSEKTWDLVISDYSLPGFSGLEALEIFRKSGVDIPFIMVSGTIGEDIAVETMRAGAHDYVMKDSLKRLLPAVNRELQEAQVRRLGREADAQLTRERQISDLIIDSIPGIFFLIDAKGRLERWNRNLESFFGESRIRSRDIFSIIEPEDREKFREELQAAIENRLFAREIRLRHPNGEMRPFLLEARPLTQSNVQRLVCIGIETTELNKALEEKERLQGQLLQAQKMEAIGRLAGGMAHDFNNLLSVILGSLEMAWLNQRDGRPVVEELQQIQEAASRAEDLTRQLLAFSRKQTLARKVVDLNPLVTGIRKLLRRLLREDIDLRIELGKGLPHIFADPGQIEQILMNLAVNAQDALPRGGRIVVQTRPAKSADFSETLEIDPEKFVLLKFSDSGMGMDAETRSRIFEPFFTTKDFGTGLGLSTVYGIVTQHGGRVWVESQPGEGTTFYVLLPAATEVAAQQAQKSPALESLSGHEQILLVEDDRAVRKVVEKILREFGYRVFAAEDAGRALEFAQKHAQEIDLLLTDIIMPGLNGLELYDKISQFCPQARVIFMSGYTDDVLDQRVLENRDFHFLHKPVTMQRLGQVVRSVLDGKQAATP